MIYDCILNGMTVDECRNYGALMNELDEARGQLVFADNDLVDAYKHVVSCEHFRQDALNRVNRVQERLGVFSREMEEKYNDLMPRPMMAECDCESHAGSDKEA